MPLLISDRAVQCAIKPQKPWEKTRVAKNETTINTANTVKTMRWVRRRRCLPPELGAVFFFFFFLFFCFFAIDNCDHIMSAPGGVEDRLGRSP